MCVCHIIIKGYLVTYLQYSTNYNSFMFLVQVANYSDYCVLTDLDLRISVDSGWHPSHLDVFDPRTKQSRIVLFRHNRNCSLSTNLTLTADKQVRPSRITPTSPSVVRPKACSLFCCTGVQEASRLALLPVFASHQLNVATQLPPPLFP